jgi:hypothetical protein
MQRIVAIVLLISLTLNITGYHFFFCLQQKEIKTIIKKRIGNNLEAESTEQFVFSINPGKGVENPEWEGDDEFSYQEEMYDVIDKKIENGKIYVHCISDKKETRLIRNYQELMKNDASNPSSKKRSGLLLQLINTLYNILTHYDPYAHLADFQITYRALYSSLLAAMITEVPTPPPQQV